MEIDYVVPMVFPEDTLWREDFKKHVLPHMDEPAFWRSWRTGKKLIHFISKHFPWLRSIYTTLRKLRRILFQKQKQRHFEKSPSKFTDAYERWRSWGTEKQLIQLVKKNLPWVRNIYVILARESQWQDWMEDEKIKVVYHKDIIPQKYLPAFSSNTIEMFLHKIPGLSEYFIYANDDMFPLSPLEETDFFMNGKPCQHMNEIDWPSNMSLFMKRCKNAQSFVARLLAQEEPEKWLSNGHSLAPIKKSTCETLWEKGGNEIEASISTLRSAKSFSQYIYSWWQHYSGDYIDKTFPKHLVKSSITIPEELSVTIAETEGVLCINDLGTDDFNGLAKAAREGLDRIIRER